MYRIDNETAAAALPAPSADGPNPGGYFTDGDPNVPTPATVVDAEFLNMIQEEMATAIEDAGLTLDKSNRGQLSAAISALAAAVAGAVASAAQVLAGASNEVWISPGRLKYSKRVNFCGGRVAGSSSTGYPVSLTATAGAFNVATVQKTAQGTYKVTTTDTAATGTLKPQVIAFHAAGGNYNVCVTEITANSFTFECRDGGGLANPDGFIFEAIAERP